MAELLKNKYNETSLYKVAKDIQSIYSPFQIDEFLNSTIDDSWESLELKQRITKISMNLKSYLPLNYSEAIAIIDKVIINYGNWLEGFGWFFTSFIELYGLDIENWNISMGALERFTQYASSEFAVRPFIINDEKRMMEQMRRWSKSHNEDVRRLSCEGCRPALPWGQALVSFKKDPTPILPILEQLKTDPSIHVRKSVANNLNDISKTHPELVIDIAKKWYGDNELTNWIVKHGCRTLLKKGNPEVLAIFGYHSPTAIKIENYKLESSTLNIGESITFSFSLLTKQDAKIRIEYAVDYVKSNGNRNRKIFKISEITLIKDEAKDYIRHHSFKDVSVRKHYPGMHSITLIINGKEMGILEFE